MTPVADVKSLFEPRSVAVIGASHSPEKIGYKLVSNILGGGFAGNLYPVNPSGGELIGLPMLKSLDEADEPVDLACIAIPAKFVLESVRACVNKGVKHLAIITSGFSEVGNLEEERRIVALAQEGGARVLGPNIFGIYSSMARLNATFGPRDVSAGNVAILTQSGALGIAMMGKTKTENIGLSAVVSVGNKSDVDEADLLEYLADHDTTKVVLVYIEGVRRGQRLVDVLKRTTRKKPVVVIKSGRSQRGAMAAASHTGSLAGADGVFADVMRQCGVLRAETIQEAMEWCRFLAQAPAPKGENTVIVTNGGGIGVLAADACEKFAVPLYDDTKALKEAFSDAVPSFGSAKNPVDITGGATLEDYEIALNAALDSADIHAVITLGCETAVLNSEGLPQMVGPVFDRGRNAKPMVFSFVGGTGIEEGMRQLRTAGVPMFSELYSAVSCLGALYAHARNNRRPLDAGDGTLKVASQIEFPAIQTALDGVWRDNRTFLLAHEAQAIMRAAGIPVPQSVIARSLDEAVASAERIGYPVVLKIASKDILHKSDAGGIALNLDNRDEVMDAYQAILVSCRRYNPRAVIEGVEIAEMVPSGTEMIVGARRDGSFGPVVMCGLGGVYVEVLKDVSFRALPLDRREATAMVHEIRAHPILLGARGEDPKDIEAVIETILRVGAILEGCPSVTDIEINPLMVYDQGEGVKAVDVRILVAHREKGEPDA
jgi:acetyltransferase